MKIFSYSLLLIIFLIFFAACDRQMTGEDLVEKSITYHDPKGEWGNVNHLFYFSNSRPGKSAVNYQVELDVANHYFKYINPQEELVFEVRNQKCITVEGDEENCDRALLLSNYYLYLWGLPMKLKDAGTEIDKEFQRELIQEINAYVVRVPYEKDVWYFYIHPENFSLLAYKFYKDESKSIGEIIYLSGEEIVGEMRIPAERTWYRTENEEFLGTDFLLRVVPRNTGHVD